MSHPYDADARYYDLLHEGYEDDVALWQSFAGRTDRPVLEVGCGTGRVAVPLALAGADVVGIDPSPAMLALARRRAFAAGVKVDWREAALPSAQLEGERYGLVLIANDTFLYARDGTEQLAWLRACANARHFNATLVVDLPGPALWLDPATDSQPLVVASERLDDGSWLQITHVRQDDLATQVRRLVATYETTAPDGTLLRTHSEHHLRYVYRFEVQYLLQAAALQVLDVYGDFELGPLTNASERMIVTARRMEG